MTPDPYAVTEDDSLEAVVELMERRRVKRLPVLRDGRVIGIVSRANLMHALVSLAPFPPVPVANDAVIREQILAAFEKQAWAPMVSVVVRDGIVHLWGTISDDRQCKAAVVAAENVSGVKAVKDHMVSATTGSRASPFLD